MESMYCNIRDREDNEDIFTRAKLQMYIYATEDNEDSYINNVTKPFNGTIKLDSEHLFDLNSVEFIRIHQILGASKIRITTHLFGKMEVEVYGVSINEDKIVIDITGKLIWNDKGIFAWAGNPAFRET